MVDKVVPINKPRLSAAGYMTVSAFGFAVMGRISLLIGRFNDLIDYSSADYNFATFYVLLFITIVLGFWSFKNREK